MDEREFFADKSFSAVVAISSDVVRVLWLIFMFFFCGGLMMESLLVGWGRHLRVLLLLSRYMGWLSREERKKREKKRKKGIFWGWCDRFRVDTLLLAQILFLKSKKENTIIETSKYKNK